MQFYFGTAVKQSYLGVYTVAMLAACRGSAPIPVPNLNLSKAKECFLAASVVQHNSVKNAVNAACNRTIEQLLTKKYLVLDNAMDAVLILPRTHRKETYMLPVHTNTNLNWMIDIADDVAFSWLRGDI